MEGRYYRKGRSYHLSWAWSADVTSKVPQLMRYGLARQKLRVFTRKCWDDLVNLVPGSVGVRFDEKGF